VGFETPAEFNCMSQPFREARVKGLESRGLSPVSSSRGGQVWCRLMSSNCSGVLQLFEETGGARVVRASRAVAGARGSCGRGVRKSASTDADGKLYSLDNRRLFCLKTVHPPWKA